MKPHRAHYGADAALLSRLLGGLTGWQHDGFGSVGFFNVR